MSPRCSGVSEPPSSRSTTVRIWIRCMSSRRRSGVPNGAPALREQNGHVRQQVAVWRVRAARLCLGMRAVCPSRWVCGRLDTTQGTQPQALRGRCRCRCARTYLVDVVNVAAPVDGGARQQALRRPRQQPRPERLQPRRLQRVAQRLLEAGLHLPLQLAHPELHIQPLARAAVLGWGNARALLRCKCYRRNMDAGCYAGAWQALHPLIARAPEGPRWSSG